MTIAVEHIRALLTAYEGSNPAEKTALAPVWGLLDDKAEVTSRKEFRGHVTASAIVVNKGRVLMVHHRALDTWLQPGGHVEDGDTTLPGAAEREVTEETGISADRLMLVTAHPIHIDVHPIPANKSKGEPEHRHIDFRFLFTTQSEAGDLQAEEVKGAKWSELEPADLRSRVFSALGL